ncbi:MAG: ATP-dependent metallopeptidase FtsH/Yme1/Tma family protein, partial [Deltaproteobacteria bacterium]|nr:ATP-dependent metallopeptidase FtsH/Yme1/Tma family protein [Deltaproteobacteria bacterium]
MNTFYRNLSLWLVIGLVMVFIFNLFNEPQKSIQEIPYSGFLEHVKKGEVTNVVIQGDKLEGVFESQLPFLTVIPAQDPDMMHLLKEKRVTIQVKPVENTPWYLALLISWFPMLLLIGVWIFFMRQMQTGGGRALSFGRSKAKLVTDQGT